jgi:hypothetical protein
VEQVEKLERALEQARGGEMKAYQVRAYSGLGCHICATYGCHICAVRLSHMCHMYVPYTCHHHICAMEQARGGEMKAYQVRLSHRMY